ncbi:Nse1 non-SMC component of SMC5-6 complex-domain-containing protein [Phascolomyces articulosus]|uniref:Non-structural maintenance of chromosomes element 1 homolog n=1 Tax=Phascolomyces articulosus TaxID=60185 RepID=A0AAD5JMT8_9FUNG|nr:Nse1 non-SMC component of SMC5-6 complex-domain-containing protein [Phascolomyces articulosus]
MATGFTINSSTSNDINPSEYNDSHRLFLQSMLSHRILTEGEAQNLYFKICDLINCEHVEFNEFISVINHEISEISLSLRITRDETNGSSFIGLVNTKEDELAQIATKYTPNEITYFRQMIETIVMADDDKYAIGSMVAIRLGQTMKPPLTQKETQTLIDRLNDDQWICPTPDGSSYCIDTRGIMELQGYLNEQYGDVIKHCKMCHDIVTMGERCELQNCEVRFHRHCADGQFSGRTIVCPECETGWSRTNIFGLGLPL